MRFEEVLQGVIDLLQRRGRLTYRAIKRQFDLTDEYLEDIKHELIKGQRLALDEGGEVLVWAGADAAGASVPTAATSAAAMERRQLSVLFCDLVDSTRLAQATDPEEFREVLQRFYAACRAAIDRYKGYVALYAGDGLLVYFGYPTASDDDARRAVLAALALVDEVGKLNTEFARGNMGSAGDGVRLAVRAGIHTGLVVIGAAGPETAPEDMAQGATLAIASRIQNAAERNTVLISPTTHRLVRGFFNCESAGTHHLKGIEQEMVLYRVVGETGARTRLAAAAASGLSPFVGRGAETDRLLAGWNDARAGSMRIALVRGDAGIGKSRLVLLLQERASDDPDAWVMELRCSPFHQNSALYPTIDYLERMRLRFERDESAADRLKKIEHLVAEYGIDRAEAVPLLAALLSVPLGSAPGSEYPALNLTPQRQKEKTFDLLLSILLERAQRQPVLLVIEDLHWADPSTLELLDKFLERQSATRVFMVFTFRPDFEPRWAPRPDIFTLDLAGFPPGEGEKIIERVAAHKPLPREAVDYILAKTDGIPLFLEELTATIVESEALVERNGHVELAAPLEKLAVPETLQDSLTARLDRQHDAKGVAQLGAVIGREFTYEMVEAIPGPHHARLDENLARLVDAGILFQKGEPPSASYQFKHALIQDSAYSTLLKSARRDYHRMIAQMLEKSAQIEQTRPELIGHHYAAAGLAAQAIPYFQKAGQQAVERSANREAIADLTKALQLAETLPEGPERAGAELLAQTYLGLTYMMTGGYAHPAVERAYSRARDLCRRLGDPPQLFPVMHGLVKYHLVRAEYATGIDLAAQLLEIARVSNDRSLLVEALYVHGAGLFWTGNFVPACEKLEQGFTLYDPNEDRAHTTIYGADPSIVCHAHHCWALAIRGYPEQALEEASRTVELANEIGHPWSLGYILRCAALTAQICRNVELALKFSGEEFALAVEQSFPFWLAGASMTQGWALCQQGRIKDGIAKTLEGMSIWLAVGTELGVPLYRGHLAEHYCDEGRIDEGLAMVADCLARIEKGGEHLYEAELYRVKGDLLLKQDAAANAEAEGCYQRAIELAQGQGAKAWHLRAAMRLARLWQSQNRAAEARALLAAIYDEYTEGFGTPDLLEARALLDGLSGRSR